MSLSNLFTNCAWNPRAFMSNKYLSFLLPWVLIVLILGQLTRKKKIKKKNHWGKQVTQARNLISLCSISHFSFSFFLFFFFSFFFIRNEKICINRSKDTREGWEVIPTKYKNWSKENTPIYRKLYTKINPNYVKLSNHNPQSSWVVKH